MIFGIAPLWFCALAVKTPAQRTLNKTPDFRILVERKLKKDGKISLKKICPIHTDSTAKRIFSEYGAIFIAADKNLPSKCIFDDETQVRAFQTNLTVKGSDFDGVTIELRESAMNALLEAQKEAAAMNLQITPRGGSIAGRRSFQNTVDLWNSRFYPALDYWVGQGKISPEDAAAAKALPIKEQVARVLGWERKELYFSKDLSKSILYSVAAPGASQHIFLLALDVEQFDDLRVRNILARHGWFQTVKSDLPHFTYLGVKEEELPSLGLVPYLIDGHKFWIPAIK